MNLKYLFKLFSGIIIVGSLCAFNSCHFSNQENDVIKTENLSHSDVKRIGMVIRIDSSKIKDYLVLHADSNPGVRDLLQKYNLRNFSIFMTRLDDGNFYQRPRIC